MQPGTTNFELGEITWRSRPAAIVTGLNVEPGSYWSVIARSFTWSALASPYGVSSGAGRRRHRQHAAGARVDLQDRDRLGAGLLERRLRELLGRGLDLHVERQLQPRAVAGRVERDRRQRQLRPLGATGLDEHLVAVLAAQLLLVALLEAGQAVAVDVGGADDGGAGAGRIDAALLGDEREAGRPSAPRASSRPAASAWRTTSMCVPAFRSGFASLAYTDSGSRSSAAAIAFDDAGGIRQRHVRADRRRLVGDGELVPAPVDDVTAAGVQHDTRAVLGGGERDVVVVVDRPAGRRRARPTAASSSPHQSSSRRMRRLGLGARYGRARPCGGAGRRGRPARCGPGAVPRRSLRAHPHRLVGVDVGPDHARLLARTPRPRCAGGPSRATRAGSRVGHARRGAARRACRRRCWPAARGSGASRCRTAAAPTMPTIT